MDSSDERGTISGAFRAPDISPVRRSSDIADEVAELPIETSGRVHPSLRSAARSERSGSRVTDSTDEESGGTETFGVSDASPLRGPSDIAESLAESPIITFGDWGNSLRIVSRTEDTGCCT